MPRLPGLLLATMLLLGAPAAQAAQTMEVNLLDGGGNGAAWGLVTLRGPETRLQGGSCPARSGGETPDGTVQCLITYDQPQYPDEWQIGDVVVARARRTQQATIPPGLRPSPSENACVAEFQGWSGACVGKTGYDAGTDTYVCEIVLPSLGGVWLGASFSGHVVLSGADCPALTAPATTTTTVAGSTSTTTTTLFTPDPLVQAIDAMADGLLGKALERGLAQLGTKFTTSMNTAGVSGRVSASATAVGTGARAAGGGGDVILARGKAKLRDGTTRLALKPTRKGRRFLKAATEATVRIDVEGTSKSRTYAATRTVTLAR